MNSMEISKTITWKDHRKKIFEEQLYLFDNSFECDCVLISADGKRFPAHQIVLSSSSEFFRKILSESPPHIDLHTIHLPDADSCILEAIVKFIYTGQVYIGVAHVTPLMEYFIFLGLKCYAKDKFTVCLAEQTCDTSLSECSTGDENLAIDTDDANRGLDDDLDEIEPDYLEEYLDESLIDIKEEHISAEKDDFSDSRTETMDDDFMTFETESVTENIEIASVDNAQTMIRRQHGARRQGTHSKNVQIDKALNEVNNGKTIHRLSLEYNLPRSTLYHRFRNNENLKQNYRSERKSALDNAVRAVLNERLSLKMAADRYKVTCLFLTMIYSHFQLIDNSYSLIHPFE